MTGDRQDERDWMVQAQLRRRGIVDSRVLEAFRKVQRHRFVAPQYASRAYEDGPLPIGWGQTISQPYMVALMTESAQVGSRDRCLEIGTGCGYQTAILAELGAQVFSIERIPELAREARIRLDQLGCQDVRIRVANGTLGWEEEAPFDAIIVAAGSPGVPAPLAEQLASDGRLVIPLEEGPSQTLYVVKKTEKGFTKERKTLCTFVPLIGEHGWRNRD